MGDSNEICGHGCEECYFIWKIMVNPHNIQVKYILIFLYIMITYMVNMRDFNSQQIALDHRVEERGINNTLHDDDDDDVCLKENRKDHVFHDMQIKVTRRRSPSRSC